MNHLRIPLSLLLSSQLPSGAALIFQGNDVATFDGTEPEYIEVFDNARVTFEAPAFVQGESGDDSIFFAGNSLGVINGGIFARDIAAAGNSNVTFNSGSIGDELWAYGTSTLTLNGGLVANDLELGQGATVFINGGLVNDDLNGAEDVVITVSDGTIRGGVDLFDNANLTINGGTFESSIHLRDNSVTTITGGNFEGDLMIDSDITISGGNFDLPIFSLGFAAAGGTITLEGSDWAIDGNPINGGLVPGTSGFLTGILADGSPLAVPFEMQPVDGTGARVNSIDGQLLLIPEPQTSLLTGLALLGLLRHRRRF